MTFAEIKEMINSTIVENGERQITGKALNLALLEMVTAMEGFKPEGSGAELVYLPSTATGEMNTEQQAHNAEVYAKFKTAYEEGKPMPALLIDGRFLIEEVEVQFGAPAMASGYIVSSMVMYISEESPLAAQSGHGVMIQAILGGSDMLQCMLNTDGSITLMM